jgi:hypothetical protein
MRRKAGSHGEKEPEMRTAIDVFGLGLMIFILALAALAGTTCEVQFQSGVELRRFATEVGFGTRDAGTEQSSNFYITDRTLSDDEWVMVSRKDQCGLTEPWRGVVWACQIRRDTDTLVADCLGGKWRTWGNLVVAGDEELMDRIEQFARERRAAPPR